MRGAAVSGRIDPDIDTLATVLLTSLSVMTLHDTVIFHPTYVSHATLSLNAHGVEVQIPRFQANEEFPVPTDNDFQRRLVVPKSQTLSLLEERFCALVLMRTLEPSAAPPNITVGLVLL